MFLRPSLKTLRRLLRSEEASVLPIIALSLIVLIGVVGTAVDMSRASLVQVKISSALDAAGLAAGATVNTTNTTMEAQKYFNANFPSGYLNSDPITLNVTASPDNMVLSLSAKTNQATTLMRVLHQNSVAVGASSQITRTSKGLELVLALDNTYSMTTATSDGTRISDLKSAAANLVNILYGSGAPPANLWVGVVPFSQTVNIGKSHVAWVDTTSSYATSLDWGPATWGGWGGCVEARTNPPLAQTLDTADDPPSVEKLREYYSPDQDNYINYYGTLYYTGNHWINTTTTKVGGVNVTTKSYTNTNSTLFEGPAGPSAGCPQSITPMTSNKMTLLNNINAMTPAGDTHINLGAVWAWRMLSPRWRTLWGGEMDLNNLPLDYNTPLMTKAVVLMTDGDNTMMGNEVISGFPIPETYSAYGYESYGRLGTTNNDSVAEAALNARTLQVCNNMKAHGIVIYTVAFGGDPDATALSLLQSCASNPEYFFNSPTPADLQTAFHTIGDSLASLRVSQ